MDLTVHRAESPSNRVVAANPKDLPDVGQQDESASRTTRPAEGVAELLRQHADVDGEEATMVDICWTRQAALR